MIKPSCLAPQSAGADSAGPMQGAGATSLGQNDRGSEAGCEAFAGSTAFPHRGELLHEPRPVLGPVHHSIVLT